MQKYLKPALLGGAAVFAYSQTKEMAFVKGVTNELLRTAIPYAAAGIAVLLVDRFV